MKATILVTSGDPKGIGPEVTYKAIRDPKIKRLAEFIILDPVDDTGFGAIKKAVEILNTGRAHGLVTAPVNKAAINKAGIPFSGHTEYLARVTRTRRYAMMLCGKILKVTLVTRHIPLKDVPIVLTRRMIIDAIELTDFALRTYFRMSRPRIGICGLNPHCGEMGVVGKEDEDLVLPAVERAKRKLFGVEGVYSADVAFYMAYKRKLDAIVAMYHDQGLGPFKMLEFEHGVNVTLGLPFVRTSPDHGTAYTLAGKGVANPGSMKAAIRLAVKMCTQDMLSRKRPC